MDFQNVSVENFLETFVETSTERAHYAIRGWTQNFPRTFGMCPEENFPEIILDISNVQIIFYWRIVSETSIRVVFEDFRRFRGQFSSRILCRSKIIYHISKFFKATIRRFSKTFWTSIFITNTSSGLIICADSHNFGKFAGKIFSTDTFRRSPHKRPECLWWQSFSLREDNYGQIMYISQIYPGMFSVISWICLVNIQQHEIWMYSLKDMEIHK